MKISGAAKTRSFVALVSVLALLGTMFSVSVHAANNLNKKNDRSKRLIELANPSGVVITPGSTSLAITFNTVANATSYTVQVYLGSTGERLVGSPSTGFNSGDSVTGLTPSTDYRVSVQAIGDQTRYSNSVDPRKFRTRTTAPVTTPFTVTWSSNCPDAQLCTPASGGQNFYIVGESITSTASLPSQPGWTFTGWSSDNSYVAAIFPSTPVSPFGNVTFTAQRALLTYNVTWNTACLNGEVCTPGTGGTATYTAGQSITPPSDPLRPGFTFIGWSSSNSGVALTATSTPVAPYGNLIFTAQWSEDVVQTGGDGLSENTAGASAFQIKRDFPNSLDGLYWVKNSNINSGLPFKIYADMTGYGGGWTLIFANAAQSDNRTWTNQEVQSVNPLFAPANPKEMSTILGKYSILNFADYLKSKPSGFQYRIDASEFGRYGGIWTANADYSFSDFNNNLKTNISEVAIWDYVYWDNGIEKRMPWASDGSGRLTTSEDSSGGAWWGTLASFDNGWQPAPWIQGSMEAPQSIWYWVR